MKVPVLEVDDITFGRYSWWSSWFDIAVFDYAHNGYLLQMQVSRRNKKRFRCVGFKGLVGVAQPTTHQVVDLLPMSKEPTNV